MSDVNAPRADAPIDRRTETRSDGPKLRKDEARQGQNVSGMVSVLWLSTAFAAGAMFIAFLGWVA
jgi:hypothetical protein